jgi:guanylate kinase
VIIVIEGPSGVGKDTIMREMIRRRPDRYKKIVSYSTRTPRDGEINGVEYIFVDKETFLKKVKTGEIFEHTMRHGTYRGIGKDAVNDIIDKGYIALKDTDMLGVRALQRAYPGKVLTVFITARKDLVEKRMRERGCTPEDLVARLADYDECIVQASNFDYVFENNGPIDQVIEKIEKALKESK